MNKKNKGLLIFNIIIAVIALCFIVLAVGAAFEIKFVVDLEWNIIHDWGWAKFNILAVSLIGIAVSAALIIGSLLISDEKSKKQAVRVRRVQKI